MASYHLQVKTISRSQGRSATAAAAYRAGERIHDARQQIEHDYTRKRGVEHAAIVLPAGAPAWAEDRAGLWNAAEAAENRKNSQVAREFEVALPHELDHDARVALALDFAAELVDRHQVAADVAIHAPHRDGDERNAHAHIMLTTRRLDASGLGEKTREFVVKSQSAAVVSHWRERWADMQNAALQAHGEHARVDHRSLAAQGLGREAEIHLGPDAAAAVRNGDDTHPRSRRQTAIRARNAALRAGHHEYARHSDRELARAIRVEQSRSTPEQIAARDSAVREADKAIAAARKDKAHAWAAAEQAKDEAQSWRKAHPMRTWANARLGVVGGVVAAMVALGAAPADALDKLRRDSERKAAAAAEREAAAVRARAAAHHAAVGRAYRAVRASRHRLDAMRTEQAIRRLERDRDRYLARSRDRKRDRGRGGIERGGIEL